MLQVYLQRGFQAWQVSSGWDRPRGEPGTQLCETGVSSASGTVRSVHSDQRNYMLHGRVFQDEGCFYLVCLRSLSVVGDLCAGDLQVWWKMRHPHILTFLHPQSVICQLCLPRLVRSP